MSIFSKSSKKSETIKPVRGTSISPFDAVTTPMFPVPSMPPVPSPTTYPFSMGGTIEMPSVLPSPYNTSFPGMAGIQGTTHTDITEERRKFLENVKVEDIHNEFFLAQETLLKEAEEHINSKENEEHLLYAKLHRMGFYNHEKAQTGNYVEIGIANKKNLHEKIMYYKQKYPLYKFITEQKVNEICEKYNILVGNTSDFIGEIPKKNLLEIVNFKIDKEDIIMGIVSMGYQIATTLTLSVVEQSVIESSLNDINKNFILESFKKNLIPFMPDFSVKGAPLHNLSFPKMKICAPIKDFNMQGKQVVGYKIVDIPVNDPIVLFPVESGFLIVSAWGDEAKDVVNEINN